ncbi:zinc-dependent metalloprotease family protein [Luminiphilus sp.]|nr:zinc-dependent metalloprotease family protein [Luminiphilus sp.]
MLFAVATNGADEITNISVIQADTGRETALKRKLPIGLIHARPGDRLVLSAGRTRKHIFLVSESKESSLGNTIIRGETVSGGRVLLVIDDEARIKGHFQEPDGMVQLTTDEFGVTTAWREGIDTVPVPFKCELENPPDSGWPDQEQLQSHRSSARTPVQASKFVVEEEEPEVRFARYATGHATVRVLIYYETGMENYIGRLADFLVELTNEALEGSYVPLSLEAAGLVQVELEDPQITRDVWDLMNQTAPPFESLKEDLLENNADLAATLIADGAEDDEWGGIASIGGQFNVETNSVTRYSTYKPGEPFYSSYSFAHEIGHNLGAKHARWQYTEGEMADNQYNFSYAYGYRIEGSRRTIMSYWSDGAKQNGTFSNPEVLFEGQPMGVAFNEERSADLSRAFWNNRHVASSLRNGGDIASEQVTERLSIYESECGEELEEGEEKGVARRHSLSFNSNTGVRINSRHKIRSDGSAQVYRYSSDWTYASHYDCRLPDEGLSSLGTEYVESFFRYIDPTSGELVESAHVFWEEDMGGDYSHIRVAHTDGGKAVGNTSLLLKVGSEHTVEFDADYGRQLTDIKSSCDGRRAGNSYIVSVTSDDCRVEATFGKGDSGTLAQDTFLGLLSVIQGLGQPVPEPSAENQFVGTYHIFRPKRPGREDFIRIGDDQSLAFGSNTTYYRWELNNGNLDVYYMYQPDDPAGDYSFTLSQDQRSGRIEVTDSSSSSTYWDFYGEQKSTDSEFEFDLYELGRDWYGDEQHILRCFNIGRHKNSFYSTSWYSGSQLPATSTDLEECRSYCPAILEDYQERDPDNWSDRICEGDEDSSAAFVNELSN